MVINMSNHPHASYTDVWYTYNHESLHDVVVALEAHHTKCYHFGMGRNPIAKTIFASANQNQRYSIFEDFAFFMMSKLVINRQQIFLS